MNDVVEIQNSENPQIAASENGLETITYSPFIEELVDIEMNVWRGDNIALLTPADKLDRYDPTVLQKIVSTIDRAWEFYAEFTGREPTLFREIDGLTTIAVVPRTCGAGCGYLGFTGIEIWADPYFDEWLHDTVADTDQYDQILFYELGRNFWFYGSQLGSLPGNPATAFAVTNRFLSMENKGIEGATYEPGFSNLPFEELRALITDDTRQVYLGDDTLNWSNTILNNTDGNPLTAGDLLPSIFGQVYEDFGNEAYGKLWQLIGSAPATSDAEVATNLFIDSASAASGIDYSFLLKGPEWRFEVGGRGDDVLEAVETEPGQTSVTHGLGGNDFIEGTMADDFLFGGSGDDVLLGKAGNDTAVGGSGNDRVLGGEGDDRLFGGADNDFLDGGKGNDFVDGGSGNDLIGFGEGQDVVKAGSGDDFVYAVGDHYSSRYSNSEIDLGAGTDSLYSPFGNNVITGTDNNTIGIGSGNDTVTTADGDDFVYSVNGGGDNNSLNLGNGNNTVWVEQGSYSITTGTGDDSIGLGNGVDVVRAGDGNNIVYKVDGGGTYDGTKDIVTGSGDDYIQTGSSDDLIDGGTGLNTLFGGAGADLFTIRSGAYNFLGDFEIDIDRISLGSLNFSDLSFFQGTGDVAADAFIFAGSEAIAQVANTTITELNNSTSFV